MAKIQKGSQLPTFQLKNQNDELVDSQSFNGKPVVIYFYPKDDTPGCTAEACSFRDSYEDFTDAGAEVVGISADSPKSHAAFAKKHRLPFVLLSDKGNKVRKLFGVPGSLFGLLPGRVTYIFDKNGVCQHVFDSQMNATKHVKEAMEAIK
ncbi:MAG: peroxiredoxin [Saprospiraceae bacterium]